MASTVARPCRCRIPTIRFASKVTPQTETTKLLLTYLLRERECKHAGRTRNRDVLAPTDHIRHRRRLPVLSDARMPQFFPRFRIERDKRTQRRTEEDESAGRRKQAAAPIT